MKRVITLLAIAIIALSMPTKKVSAHCEIPCGIYGDSIRISLIQEHLVTIEKSMNMINELSNSETPDFNQLVRWVNNKEQHAEKIQTILSQYFLHQRIKLVDSNSGPKYKKYQTHLEQIHKMLVYSMKFKQSLDHTNIHKFEDTLKEFTDSYFNE